MQLRSLSAATALFALFMTTACGDAVDVDTPLDALDANEAASALVGNNSSGAANAVTFGLGDGRNGDLSLAAGTTKVVNRYAAITAAVAVGATSITVGAGVGDSAGFLAGDIIMIHRFTGDTAAAATTVNDGITTFTVLVAGSYEFARVQSVSGSTITLVEPLSLPDAIPAGEAQAIRVPQFRNMNLASGASITATPFDGSRGGVVAIFASGTITNAGTISANGAGYRGGVTEGPAAAEGCDALNGPSGTGGAAAGGAHKGEGPTVGVFSTALAAASNVYGRGVRGSGGGGGNCNEAGGGGGGNGGRGGRGGITSDGRNRGGQGGAALTSSTRFSQRLWFGGGGGAGEADTGGAGGAGGGIVFLRTKALAGNGTISAIGANGVASLSDGDGGAGAGGTVFVQSASSLSCQLIDARGGSTSPGGLANGIGGGGGGGAVRLEAPVATTCPTNVTGGISSNQDAGNGNQNGANGVAEAIVVTLPVCGDATVQAGEQCDDGNRVGADGCSSECRTETCGALTRLNATGNVVQLCAAPDTWDRAARSCASRNGWRLATLESTSEATDVRTALGVTGVVAINGNDQRTEGTFRAVPTNVNGLTTLGFAAGENVAATSAGQDCVVSVSNTTVGDRDCDTDTQAYICEATCRDGVVADGEVCDDGNAVNTDACTNRCLLDAGEVCTANTQCDTGVCDLLGGGRCEAASVCGNGRIDQASERCDDGNTTNGDGCNSACVKEPGASCAASNECTTNFCDNTVCACNDDADCGAGKVCDITASPNTCENANVCGNGAIEAGEVCEDGNTTDGDGCSSTCKRENGGACAVAADCDSAFCDGNVCACNDATDCAANEFCDLTPTPNQCRPSNACGNGLRENAEGCDDGNNANGDGCNAGCQIELASACTANAGCASGFCEAGFCRCDAAADCSVGQVCDVTAVPNACEAANTCGNGTTEVGESCDDGNTANGDTCASNCTLFVGGTCSASTQCESGSCENGACTCLADNDCPANRRCDVGNAPNACEALNVCGNGLVEGTEACDDSGSANNDGCSAACLFELGGGCSDDASCATGLCDGAICACNDNSDCGAGRVCDANETPNTCEASNVCGNGIIEAGEVCDDGNTDDGDGCTSACRAEIGATCAVNSDCVSNACVDDVCACDGNDDCGADNVCDPTAGACEATNSCGNGVLEGTEACDVGAAAGDATCEPGCRLPLGATCTSGLECGTGLCSGSSDTCVAANACGNGVLEASERCDDGGVTGGDGCSEECTEEPGFDCNGVPSVCTTECGDGVVAGAEGCDDDNGSDDDGCDSSCSVEAGFVCVGTPSACSGVCGDGLVRGDEACDDNNTDAGDGCSPTCTVESGEGEGEPAEGEGEPAEGEGEPAEGEGEPAEGEGEPAEGEGEPAEGEGEGPAPSGCASSGNNAAAFVPLALLPLLRRRRVRR